MESEFTTSEAWVSRCEQMAEDSPYAGRLDETQAHSNRKPITILAELQLRKQNTCFPIKNSLVSEVSLN